MKITDLRVEDLPAGSLFIGVARPAFSWKIAVERRGAMQVRYRIFASAKPECARGDLWDSNWVDGSRNLHVVWGGEPLASRQKVYFRIESVDERGETATSEIASFETALLNNRQWRAKWIAYDGNNPSVMGPCPYFRRAFEVKSPVVSARLYVAARGIFEPRMNGEKIGRDYFVPGWTDFARHIQYMSYDVTSQLRPGENVLGAILADGWFCGNISIRARNRYGDTPELLMQLEITYEDGQTEIIGTDHNFRCATGPILYSDFYDGEMYDRRLEMPGWDAPGFDDVKWRAAKEGAGAASDVELVAKTALPVRRIMEIKPVALLHPKPDVWIWDMGQNISGFVRIRLRGIEGRLNTMRFGEMLYPDGTLYNLNYRSARSTDYYVNAGAHTEMQEYEPRFTFHGFRYVQIDGFQFGGTDCSAEAVEVTGVVLHSELEVTGHFRCGHEKINQLYRNVCWGQRDNFFEVPTDCPQRDERLGWTGDAEVFAGTAAFNMQVHNFLRKYLRDMREARRADGGIACIAPDVLKGTYDGAAWADAAVIIPWVLYQRYGDERVLSENYQMMCQWVEFQHKTTDGLIRPDTPFGDWLALSAMATPSSLIGTAYFAWTSRLLGEAAQVLGKDADATRYKAQAFAIRNAFRARFLDEEKCVKPRTQTACALALTFDLLEDDERAVNGRLLCELVRSNGDKLDTGFVGTACLCRALSSENGTEKAYDLLLQEEYPSWLFSVNQGATTIWERWNSYTVKDGFGNVNMNSFNHYAYGAVFEWVAATVCGIRYATPGGRKMMFAAEPDARLGFVESALETPNGLARSDWKFVGDELHWTISAPPNTEVMIVLPAADPALVSCQEIEVSSLELTVPNGTYHFVINRQK